MGGALDLVPRRLRRRLLVAYVRHRRIFWLLHSLWALATGVLVLVLSHDRWGLAGWVMLFLGITWLSTLFFGRLSTGEPTGTAGRLGRELVSYLTRVMYQETLFFLLPFYYSSATPGSSNLLFVVLLAGLAVLSCLDLVFDELLRRHRWFGLLFFAVVAFASLNFLLPVLLRLRLELATPIAALAGLLAALPLVWDRGRWRRPKELAQLAAGLALAALLVWPGRGLLPPVPLRLLSLEWAGEVAEDPVRAVEPLRGEASLGELPDGSLAVVAEVFAPRRLESRVVIEWRRDGTRLRRSRQLEITPHRLGFSVWHAYRPAEGPLRPGLYRIDVLTGDGRLLGTAALRLRSAPPPSGAGAAP